MLNLAKCVLVKSKLLWPLEAALYSSNLFEIMSYQEIRFQVGLVDGPLGVLFCQSFSLQTVLRHMHNRVLVTIKRNHNTSLSGAWLVV